MEFESTPLLRVRDATASYGSSRVLSGVDLDVPQRGVVAVVGRNGAGKTTLLRCLMGYHPLSGGTCEFEGRDVSNMATSKLVSLGFGYVPQDSVVFPNLTVRENLVMGLQAVPRAARQGIEPALDLFPKLAERLGQKAGTMSGGERKMVGIARALLGQPRILIMDEPTEGVWQGVVEEIAVRLKEYSERHAILLVEQHLEFAQGLAERLVVMDRGEVAVAGRTEDLKDDPRLREYLTI